ncbi:MAG TPA: hypothetical protein VGI95_11030 [Caulobacteraceae bacterium]|jgi:hypothetical protein
MNGLRAKLSVVAAAALFAASTGAHAAPATSTADAIADAERPAPLPTFASIPPAPKDLRPFAAWRSAIHDTKVAGAQVYAEGAATPWTLGDTEGWAAHERALAAAPAPMTSPSEGDTEAFVKAMRARATPPPRAH